MSPFFLLLAFVVLTGSWFLELGRRREDEPDAPVFARSRLSGSPDLAAPGALERRGIPGAILPEPANLESPENPPSAPEADQQPLPEPVPPPKELPAVIESKIQELERSMSTGEEDVLRLQKVLKGISQAQAAMKSSGSSAKSSRKRNERTPRISRLRGVKKCSQPATKDLVVVVEPRGAAQSECIPEASVGLVEKNALRIAKELLSRSGSVPQSVQLQIRALLPGFLTAVAKLAAMPWQEEAVRYDAVIWMGKARLLKALPTLTALLRDPSPSIRYASAASLANFGAEEAGPLLIEHLRDRNSFVRSTIAAALGRLEFIPGFAPLVRRLNDRSGLVRLAVREAILEFPEEVILRKLPRILEGASENICRPGLRVLAQVRHFGRNEALVRLLQSDREPLRSAAVEVALALGDEEFLEPLAQALERGDREILETLAGTVSGPEQTILPAPEAFGGGDAMPFLQNLPLRTEDLFARIETFRRMPLSISREKLLDLYGSVPERLQAAVVHVLAELPHPEVFQDLKTLLEKSPSSYVKSALVTGLSGFGQRAEPLLIPLLRESDQELLYSTVKALATVGGPSSLDALSRIRQHANPTSHFYTERALEEIRSRQP